MSKQLVVEVSEKVLHSFECLMYNVLKEGGDLKPFTPEDYANNFKIINKVLGRYINAKSRILISKRVNFSFYS